MSYEQFRPAVIDHACVAHLGESAVARITIRPSCSELLEEERGIVAGIEADLQGALQISASPDFSRLGLSAAEGQEADRPKLGRWIGFAAAAALALTGYLVVTDREPGNRQHLTGRALIFDYWCQCPPGSDLENRHNVSQVSCDRCPEKARKDDAARECSTSETRE